MNKLIALITIPALTLAACNEPDGDTADMAPDAVSGDLNPNDSVAGDGGAPELANVQAAIDEECPTLRAVVSSAVCEAQGLDLDTFECSYSFAQDPEGSERTLMLTRGDDGIDWDLEQEPDFCGSLDRAAMVADEPADVSVDTQPTE